MEKFDLKKEFKIVDSKLAYNFGDGISSSELYLVEQEGNLFIIDSSEDSIDVVAIKSKEESWDEDYPFSNEEGLVKFLESEWNGDTYVFDNGFYVGIDDATGMETL